MRYFFDTEFIEDGKTIELVSIGIVAADGREFYRQIVGVDYSRADEWFHRNVLPELTHYSIKERSRSCNTSYNSELSLSSAQFESRCAEYTACPWTNTARLCNDIINFVSPIIHGHSTNPPEFWAYYADYDWVALRQLYGRMRNLPKGWPMYCRDLRQLLDEHGLDVSKAVPQTDEHNALADAKWVWTAYEYAMHQIQ